MLEGVGVITRYLERAMAQARYDLLGPGRFVAELPEVGLKVEASHLEAAREALREALEAWLLSALRSGALPPGLEVEEDPRRARFFALAAEMWRVLSEAPPAPPPKGAKEEPREAPRPKRPPTLEAWLQSLGIQVVKKREEDEEKEKVLTRLALFLGDRYPSLEKLYERLKQSLSTERQFELSLADAGQEEIANSTQFCTLLKQYALLTSYHYKREERRIRAKASTEGWVQNFFTGAWLERYVAERLRKHLRSKNLPHELAMGYQVTLPSGEAMELDILVRVGERVFWFEAKTGEFQAHIGKYAGLKKVLGLSQKESFLVLLGMDKARAKELSALHGLTVVNQANFLDAFQEALEGNAP
ncbi:MAG: type II toxin-antitoxin system HicB family antitoxin [Thermus aquaticus]|uniref:type II toxin-antitoxin system HicB family antitoxin n=1 Tax=Thermus aquaticus TaxID=271 RepID=UPI003C0F083A